MMKKTCGFSRNIPRFFILTALILILGAQSGYGQSTPRAWYVKEKSSDDNNGRSPETPFESLTKAFASAASSPVKTIIIIGQYYGLGGSSTPAEGTGAAEILVTAMDDQTVMGSRIGIYGNSKIRFENITFGRVFSEYRGRLEIGEQGEESGPVVTVGKNTVFGDHSEIKVNSGILVMEGNALVRGENEGIAVSGGELTIKDDVKITYQGSYYQETGIGVGGGKVILQDRAQVSGYTGSGVAVSGGTFLMRDSSVVSGNTNSGRANLLGTRDGGGIRIADDSGGGSFPMVVLMGNASVTGNSTNGKGGGIYVGSGYLGIKENAVISGNTARQGGGVYFKGIEKQPLLAQSGYVMKNTKPSISRLQAMFMEIAGGRIADNTAQEGGGVYAANGSVETSLTVDYTKNTASVTYDQLGIEMTGGVITGNKADYGAGVYIVSDELSFKEQRALVSTKQHDMIVYEIRDTGKQVSKPSFVFKGGSITGNEANFVGGGIWVKTKGAYTAGKGTLSGNTAGDGEGEDLYTP
ncbi:MAG: hypothetical protein LBS57_04935 [Treponema sp.]|nr:hypothetical protein [Treponema sp.]